MLKKISDDLNLNKRFEGYFNKKIFRGVIVVIIIFTAIIFFKHKTLSFIYAECPNESAQDCANPFYICPKSDEFNIYNTEFDKCTYYEVMPDKIKKFCDSNNNTCYEKHIGRGEIIGNKPPAYVVYYNQISLLFVAIAFFINHLNYKYKKKRG